MKMSLIITLLQIAISSYSQEIFKVEKFINKFPYKERTVFKISDSLDASAKIDRETTHSIFQYFSDEPTWNGFTFSYNWTKIHVSDAYLLSYYKRHYHSMFKSDFDIITVYANSNNSQIIYWLAYANTDYDPNDDYTFNRGKLYNWLEPALAEKYVNDSVIFESYSQFIDDMVIKKTSITKDLNQNLLDSTIQIINLIIADYYVLSDEMIFRNGKIIRDFSDMELRKKYGY